MISTYLPVVIGVIVILAVLRDIFHTLFHPSSRGSLSSRLIRTIWNIFRAGARRSPNWLSLAGPISLLAVIASWTLMLALGWALIVWQFLPEEFLLSSGMFPEDNTTFFDAFYLSLVTLATLGYGDITPTTTWLRLVSPLEALIGFGLITAAISWILSVQPVLSRRRHLAQEVSLLDNEDRWEALLRDDTHGTAVSGILHSLTEQVLSAEIDYRHTPITYYFRQQERRVSIEVSLPRLAVMTQQASQHASPAVRGQAEVLRVALHDLVQYLGDEFLDMPDASMDDILPAFADDHLHEPARETGTAAEVLS